MLSPTTSRVFWLARTGSDTMASVAMTNDLTNVDIVCIVKSYTLKQFMNTQNQTTEQP